MEPAPELIVLDVNETLSDLAPLGEAFTEIGLAVETSEAWFAAVLRDGFALTILGGNPGFADLARAEVSQRLRAGRPGVSGQEVADAADAVLETFMTLRLHPDVLPGLEAFRAAGSRVVTFTNGAAAVAQALFADAPDGMVERFLSVTEAGAWKPSVEAYAHPLEVCGVAAADALMVAVHPWDLEGAHRAGLRTGWLNRRGTDYPEPFTPPDHTADTLVDLAGGFGPRGDAGV